uniref:ERC protein 2 n=1 Tax=Macrostomum lignano TaxID=282301 RepID=A0A1I8FBV7_9PLAT
LQAELERLRQKQLASSSGSEQSEAAVALAQDNARQALEISDLRDQLQACKTAGGGVGELEAGATAGGGCGFLDTADRQSDNPKSVSPNIHPPPVSAAVVNPAAHQRHYGIASCPSLTAVVQHRRICVD